MQKHHLYTFGLLLVGISTIIGGLDHWADAIKPSFVGGALAIGGAVLKAMYQDSPNGDQ